MDPQIHPLFCYMLCCFVHLSYKTPLQPPRAAYSRPELSSPGYPTEHRFYPCACCPLSLSQRLLRRGNGAGSFCSRAAGLDWWRSEHGEVSLLRVSRVQLCRARPKTHHGEGHDCFRRLARLCALSVRPARLTGHANTKEAGRHRARLL